MSEAEARLWRTWRDRSDGAAFAALVGPHVEFATDLARRVGCAPADADDVVQGCLVRLAGEVRDVPVRVGVQAWIGRNVVSGARTQARARRRRAEHEGRAATAAPAPADPVEVHDEVESALALLAESDRRLLELRFLHDLEYREIGFILGASALGCRLRVHRALGRVRRRLGRNAPLAIAALSPLGGARPVAETVARATEAACAAGGTGVATGSVAGVAALLLTPAWKVALAAVLVAAVAVAVGARGGGVKAPDEPPKASAVAEVASPAPASVAGSGALAAAPASLPVGAPPVPTGPRAAGRVVAADGAAVAGARVLAFPADRGRPFRLDDPVGLPSFVHATTTGPDGRFDLALDAEVPVSSLIAVAGGHAPAFLGAARDGDDVVLTLSRPGTLLAHVVDLEGIPIASARVRDCTAIDLLVEEHAATTDAAGRCRIDGLPVASRETPFLHHCVLVEADGWGPLYFPGIPVRSGEERAQDYALTRGATVVGTVLDGETGDPVEGAHVVLVSSEGFAGAPRASGATVDNPFAMRALGATTTATAGTYRFEHVPAEGLVPIDSARGSPKGGKEIALVVAWKTGTSASSDSLPAVPAGATIESSVRLWPAATIVGRCVDDAGGPIAGAFVSASAPEPRGEWVPWSLEQAPRTGALTDADGRFRLPGLPATRAAPTPFRVQGFRPMGGVRATADPDAVAEVELRAGEEKTLPDLVLSEKGTPIVRLRILDAKGAPVWRASVSPGVVEAFSERDGSVTLRMPELAGVAPLPTLRLTVRAHGFAPQEVRAAPTRGGSMAATVMLAPGRRIAGHVRDGAGRPVVAEIEVGRGDQLEHEAFGDPPPGSAPGTPGALRTPTGLVPLGRASTDARGGFVVEDLPDGPYYVRARKLSKGWRTPPPTVTLRGIAADATDVVLEVAGGPPEPGFVEGTVVDALTGKPIPAFRAVVRVGSVQRAAEVPAGVGKFHIDEIPPGEGLLTVDAAGYAPAEVRVEVPIGAGAPSVDIRLTAGAPVDPPVVEGRITTEGTDLPSDVGLVFLQIGPLRPAGGPGLPSGGTYRAQGVGPGRYRVMTTRLRPDSTSPVLVARGFVVVREGGERAADVVLVPAAFLVVAPTDERLPFARESGKPSTDAQVAFGAACRLVVTDAAGDVVEDLHGVSRARDGFLPFVPVVPGPVRVRLEMPGGEVREQTATLAAGARVEVHLEKR